LLGCRIAIGVTRHSNVAFEPASVRRDNASCDLRTIQAANCASLTGDVDPAVQAIADVCVDHP